MPLGEGRQIRLQPLVAGDVQGFSGVFWGWRAWRLQSVVKASPKSVRQLDLPHAIRDRKRYFLP